MWDDSSHDGVKAEKIRQGGQVLEQLGYLEEAIEQLAHTVRRVENCLEPVLRVEDESEGKLDAPQLVPLAAAINTLAARVRQQSGRLERILERLEL